MKLSDKELKIIYKESRPQIIKLGKEFGYRSEDCDDILQEAIVILWNKSCGDNFTLTVKASTYIYKVCKYKFLNKSRITKRIVNVDIQTIEDYIIDDVDNTEELYITKVSKLAEILKEISEKCRNLIIDFYTGLSTEELILKYKYPNASVVTQTKYNCIQQLRNKST